VLTLTSISELHHDKARAAPSNALIKFWLLDDILSVIEFIYRYDKISERGADR
jgi:hypothetical protein